MAELEKSTVRTYFACRKCEGRLEKIALAGSDTGLFGIGTGKSEALYCNNKECERFGDLTVVGIKKEE